MNKVMATSLLSMVIVHSFFATKQNRSAFKQDKSEQSGAKKNRAECSVKLVEDARVQRLVVRMTRDLDRKSWSSNFDNNEPTNDPIYLTDFEKKTLACCAISQWAPQINWGPSLKDFIITNNEIKVEQNDARDLTAGFGIEILWNLRVNGIDHKFSKFIPYRNLE